MPSQNAINIAQQMYVAYYGRPADPGGLSFWADVFDTTDDLTMALTQFGNSAEFTNNFGSLTPSDLVNNLYQQMYGHQPDPGGLDFYLGRLESGEANLASIAKQIADGSLETDLATLENRISVANLFTNTVEDTGASFTEENIPDAQALLAAVTETTASRSEGETAASTYVSELAGESTDDPGDDDIDVTSTIVGTWLMDMGDVPAALALSFFPDGSFALIEAVNGTDDNVQDSYEIGSYEYDAATGAFSYDIDVDTDAVAGMNAAGFNRVEIEENRLTFSSPVADEDGVSLTRLEAGGDSSIVGSWVFKEESDLIILNFDESGTYTFLQSSDADEHGMSGIEYGNYDWAEDTGLLLVETLVDDNGQWGISHPYEGNDLVLELTDGEIMISDDKPGDEPGF